MMALMRTRERLGLQPNSADGCNKAPCPLAGCRPPSLAAGKWQDHLHRLFEAELDSIMTHVGCATETDIAVVINQHAKQTPQLTQMPLFTTSSGRFHRRVGASCHGSTRCVLDL